jgi:hypothetical protein
VGGARALVAARSLCTGEAASRNDDRLVLDAVVYPLQTTPLAEYDLAVAVGAAQSSGPRSHPAVATMPPAPNAAAPETAGRSSSSCPETLHRPTATGYLHGWHASLQVLHPVDAADTYAHPRPRVSRLAGRGLLHRLATGYYALVPPGRQATGWRPSLQAAAYGIAASTDGP